MKLAEVEIGKEYAIGSPNQKHGSYTRFVAEEIDEFRKGNSWRRTSKKRRVKGKVLDKHTGEERREKIVDAQEVIRLWEDEVERKRKENEKNERIRKERARKKEASIDLQVQIADELEALGFEAREDYRGNKIPSYKFSTSISHYGEGTISMSFERFLEVVDKLKESK